MKMSMNFERKLATLKQAQNSLFLLFKQLATDTHPLNVTIVKFQNMCCKDNILSSCRFKGHVKLSIYYIFYQYLLCITFQHDRLLVSDGPGTRNIGNPAAGWIFEHCWMLEGRKYKSGVRVLSWPSAEKKVE